MLKEYRTGRMDGVQEQDLLQIRGNAFHACWGGARAWSRNQHTWGMGEGSVSQSPRGFMGRDVCPAGTIYRVQQRPLMEQPLLHKRLLTTKTVISRNTFFKGDIDQMKTAVLLKDRKQSDKGKAVSLFRKQKYQSFQN